MEDIVHNIYPSKKEPRPSFLIANTENLTKNLSHTTRHTRKIMIFNLAIVFISSKNLTTVSKQ